MRVFDSVCYAYRQNKGKLDLRCTKGIILGYDKSSHAYLVYFPETGKVLKYRVVKFPKADRNVNEKQTQTGNVACDGADLDDFIPCRSNFDRVVDVGILTDNADDPADGYASAAVNPEGVSVKSVPESSNCLRRQRKPPAYLDDYVTVCDSGDDQTMVNNDYCYRVSAFLQSYKEAVESPESECWIAVMREEMNSLEENNTYTLTTLPEGRKAVGVDRYTLSKITLIIPRATRQDMWLRVTAKLRM